MTPLSTSVSRSRFAGVCAPLAARVLGCPVREEAPCAADVTAASLVVWVVLVAVSVSPSSIHVYFVSPEGNIHELYYNSAFSWTWKHSVLTLGQQRKFLVRVDIADLVQVRCWCWCWCVRAVVYCCACVRVPMRFSATRCEHLPRESPQNCHAVLCALCVSALHSSHAVCYCRAAPLWPPLTAVPLQVRALRPSAPRVCQTGMPRPCRFVDRCWSLTAQSAIVCDIPTSATDGVVCTVVASVAC